MQITDDTPVVRVCAADSIIFLRGRCMHAINPVKEPDFKIPSKKMVRYNKCVEGEGTMNLFTAKMCESGVDAL